MRVSQLRVNGCPLIRSCLFTFRVLAQREQSRPYRLLVMAGPTIKQRTCNGMAGIRV